MKIYLMQHPDRKMPKFWTKFILEYGSNAIRWISAPLVKYPIKQIVLDIADHAVKNESQHHEKIMILTDDIKFCKNYMEIIKLIEMQFHGNVLSLANSYDDLLSGSKFNIVEGKYPPLRPARWINEDGSPADKFVVEMLFNPWVSMYSMSFLEKILSHQFSKPIAAPLFAGNEGDQALITDVIIRESVNWHKSNVPLATSTVEPSTVGHIGNPMVDRQQFDEEYNLLPSAKKWAERMKTYELVKAE